MTKKQIEEMNSYWWWHKIDLGNGITTPGHCPHGNEKDFESRFGLPKSLEGKSVLDVGCWDGLFSFEAEKRKAYEVFSIDIYQKCAGQNESLYDAHKPFQFAHKILNSAVQFEFQSLRESHDMHTVFDWPKYDYIFYFGVLYHIEDPLGAIKQLCDLTKDGGQTIIETTYTTSPECVLEYIPGYEDDKTNIFRPSLSFLEKACKESGFKSTELIYSDQVRCTIKAFK